MGNYRVSPEFSAPSNAQKPTVYGYCTIHNASIGRDNFGNLYKKCFTGHKAKENCDVKIRKRGEYNDK